MNCLHHRFLVHPQYFAIRHRSCGSHANHLTCQRAFAKEITFLQYADGRFLAFFGYDGESHFAGPDIKDSVRRIALGEDRLLFLKSQDLPAVANRRQEGIRVEFTFHFLSVQPESWLGAPLKESPRTESLQHYFLSVSAHPHRQSS